MHIQLHIERESRNYSTTFPTCYIKTLHTRRRPYRFARDLYSFLYSLASFLYPTSEKQCRGDFPRPHRCRPMKIDYDTGQFVFLRRHKKKKKEIGTCSFSALHSVGSLGSIVRIVLL